MMHTQMCSSLPRHVWLKASYQIRNIQLCIIINKNPYSCESSFSSLNIYGGSDSILLLAKSLQKHIGYSKLLQHAVILLNNFEISIYTILFYLLNRKLFILYVIRDLDCKGMMLKQGEKLDLPDLSWSH